MKLFFQLSLILFFSASSMGQFDFSDFDDGVSLSQTSSAGVFSEGGVAVEATVEHNAANGTGTEAQINGNGTKEEKNNGNTF